MRAHYYLIIRRKRRVMVMGKVFLSTETILVEVGCSVR